MKNVLHIQQEPTIESIELSLAKQNITITLEERRRALYHRISIANEDVDVTPFANELGGLNSYDKLIKVDNKIAANSGLIEALTDKMDTVSDNETFAIAARIGELIRENELLIQERGVIINIPVIDVIDSVPFLREDIERMRGENYEDIVIQDEQVLMENLRNSKAA